MNCHGILNSNNVIQSEWSKKLIPLHNDVKTLQELIEKHQLGPRYEGQLMSDGGA